MGKLKLSLHIFRRDLRLYDNTALLNALQNSESVIPLFIFDDRQSENPFRGNNSFSFMLNSLNELDVELKKHGSQLYVFKGIPHEVVSGLFMQLPIKALFVNRDYSPFSIIRDAEIEAVCQKHDVDFKVFADALLTEPEMVHKPDGKPYTVFTPFMKRAKQLSVSKPDEKHLGNYFQQKIPDNLGAGYIEKLMPQLLPKQLLKGGRSEGLSLLSDIGLLADYDETRNLPALKGTSLLSAHHKFGTISIRETYHAIVKLFGNDHTLINELYWRDFFTHILFHFPYVLGNAFREKYRGIEWKSDRELFDHWSKGETGFPIVDAGMRELVQTGYMHNRVRMIVASFLVKDLHLDWQQGERFFAKHLSDYDPAVNNGNWQWAASTGCDAQPYFRIFNPWSQQLKYDPQCVYVKKWIPELQQLQAESIHQLYKKFPPGLPYPYPIVDHSEAAAYAKMMFKENLYLRFERQ